MVERNEKDKSVKESQKEIKLKITNLESSCYKILVQVSMKEQEKMILNQKLQQIQSQINELRKRFKI